MKMAKQKTSLADLEVFFYLDLTIVVCVDFIEDFMNLLSGDLLSLCLRRPKSHTCRNSDSSKRPWVSICISAMIEDISSEVRSKY